MRPGIAQLYGYMVCLVGVITFLVCLGNLVAASFDLSDPLYASGSVEQQRSLSSLENYRVDVLKNLPDATPAPDDATIQAMYDAARDAQIRTVRLRSISNLTVSGLLLLVAVVLLVTHLRWLKRLGREDAAAPAA